MRQRAGSSKERALRLFRQHARALVDTAGRSDPRGGRLCDQRVRARQRRGCDVLGFLASGGKRLCGRPRHRAARRKPVRHVAEVRGGDPA